MPVYSLYEVIKDKLSPNTRKRLESKMRYNELTKKEKSNEENL